MKWPRAKTRARIRAIICTVAKALNSTGAAALASFGGLLILFLTLLDARDATVEANRAWIAPIGAEHDDMLVVGKVFRIRVVYQNTGKGPALDVTDNFFGEPILAIAPGQGWDSLSVPPNHTCNGLVPIKGHAVAYPLATYRRAFSVAEDKIDQTLVDGKRVLYIQGCFAYSTFYKAHFSSYCFYLEPDASIPSQRWQFKNCSGVEEASAD